MLYLSSNTTTSPAKLILATLPPHPPPPHAHSSNTTTSPAKLILATLPPHPPSPYAHSGNNTTSPVKIILSTLPPHPSPHTLILATPPPKPQSSDSGNTTAQYHHTPQYSFQHRYDHTFLTLIHHQLTLKIPIPITQLRPYNTHRRETTSPHNTTAHTILILATALPHLYETHSSNTVTPFQQ